MSITQKKIAHDQIACQILYEIFGLNTRIDPTYSSASRVEGRWVSISQKKIALSGRGARRPNGGPSSKLPSSQLHIDVGPLHLVQIDLVDIF